jgi:F-type H+-transporting ATPase subunit b
MTRPRLSVIACLAVATCASVAFASESAHAHAEGGVPILTILFSTVNLVIFGLVLNRYAVPQIRHWVRERRNHIVTDLEEAAKARGEAMRLKAEWEERIAKLEVTIGEMREQARRDSERERERILAEAHRMAEAIHRDAERTIAAELRAVQGDLRAQVVREAVRLAEDEVRRKWTDADQQRFVADFVQQVAK